MSDFITAKKTLSAYGETINDAVKHRVHYLKRIPRSGVTVAELADEVLDAKRRNGMSEAYLSDLKIRVVRFCRDFGNRPEFACDVACVIDLLRTGQISCAGIIRDCEHLDRDRGCLGERSDEQKREQNCQRHGPMIRCIGLSDDGLPCCQVLGKYEVKGRVRKAVTAWLSYALRQGEFPECRPLREVWLRLSVQSAF